MDMNRIKKRWGKAWTFYAVLWLFLGSVCCTPSYSADITILSQILKDIGVLSWKINNCLPNMGQSDQRNILIVPENEGYSLYISGFGILMDVDNKVYIQNELSQIIGKPVQVYDMLDIACLAIGRPNEVDQLRNGIRSLTVNTKEKELEISVSQDSETSQASNSEAQPETTAWNAYYKALEGYLEKLKGSYEQQHLNSAKKELDALNKAANTQYGIMFMTGENKSGINVEVGEQKTQSTAVKDVLKENIFTPTHPAYNGSNLYHCDHTEPMYLVHNIIRRRPMGNFFFTQRDMCNNCLQLVLKKVKVNNPTVVISAFRSKVANDSDYTGSGVDFMYNGKITPSSTHMAYNNLCRIEISPKGNMAPNFSITFHDGIVANIVIESVNNTKITTTTYKNGDNEVMEITNDGDNKLLTETKYEASTGKSIKETTYWHGSEGVTGKQEISPHCEKSFKFVRKTSDQTNPYDDKNFIQEISINKKDGKIKQKIEFSDYNNEYGQFTKQTQYFNYNGGDKFQDKNEFLWDNKDGTWKPVKDQQQKDQPQQVNIVPFASDKSSEKNKSSKTRNDISTEGNPNWPKKGEKKENKSNPNKSNSNKSNSNKSNSNKSNSNKSNSNKSNSKKSNSKKQQSGGKKPK